MAAIRHQVWIDAPVSTVFEALSTAEGLGRWWVPHTSEQAGGDLVLMHSPGPRHGDVKMKVLDMTLDQRIEWEVVSSHPEQSPASAWTGTRILFELDERGNPGMWRGVDSTSPHMTVIEFRHSGWDENSEYFGFCNFAWGVTLFMLAQWCERRDG